jgi:hypothetical protein
VIAVVRSWNNGPAALLYERGRAVAVPGAMIGGAQGIASPDGAVGRVRRAVPAPVRMLLVDVYVSTCATGFMSVLH